MSYDELKESCSLTKDKTLNIGPRSYDAVWREHEPMSERELAALRNLGTMVGEGKKASSVAEERADAALTKSPHLRCFARMRGQRLPCRDLTALVEGFLAAYNASRPRARRVPSLSVAVATVDAVVGAGAAAAEDEGVAVNPATMYHLCGQGDVAAAAVYATAAALTEGQTADLDAPIAQLLPGFADALRQGGYDELTTRHCLTGATGMPPLGDGDFRGVSAARRDAALRDWLGAHKRKGKLGKKRSDSGAARLLLATIGRAFGGGKLFAQVLGSEAGSAGYPRSGLVGAGASAEDRIPAAKAPPEVLLEGEGPFLSPKGHAVALQGLLRSEKGWGHYNLPPPEIGAALLDIAGEERVTTAAGWQLYSHVDRGAGVVVVVASNQAWDEKALRAAGAMAKRVAFFPGVLEG